MPRRIHVPSIALGPLQLSNAQAHHTRDVLRLTEGTPVEVFDDSGQVALGKLSTVDGSGVSITIEKISERTDPASALRLTIASAVPKGDRADWMVEKLSELGVDCFIPLVTARSVVLPAGKNKIERWERLAVESAKQSRRTGVLQIAPLTSLGEAMKSQEIGWYLSTAPQAIPVSTTLPEITPNTQLRLFIGPEGGWADEEITNFQAAGMRGIGLTKSILRVETAAIAAAAIMMCCGQREDHPV